MRTGSEHEHESRERAYRDIRLDVLFDLDPKLDVLVLDLYFDTLLNLDLGRELILQLVEEGCRQPFARKTVVLGFNNDGFDIVFRVGVDAADPGAVVAANVALLAVGDNDLDVCASNASHEHPSREESIEKDSPRSLMRGLYFSSIFFLDADILSGWCLSAHRLLT